MEKAGGSHLNSVCVIVVIFHRRVWRAQGQERKQFPSHHNNLQVEMKKRKIESALRKARSLRFKVIPNAMHS